MVGIVFSVSIPTLPMVTPSVPPRISSRAAGFMNAAGEVPSIMAAIRMHPAARPMPMIVAAFIVQVIDRTR